MAATNKRSNIPGQIQVRRERDEAARRRRITVRWRAGLAVVGVAAVATASLLLIHSHNSPAPPAPVSTVDSNARACVLTDPNDPSLPTVSAGLDQAAGSNAHLNVQNYPIPAADTDARALLSGLIAGRCDVVVGVGSLADQAIEAYAADGQKPAAKLIVVGDGPADAAGVTRLSPSNLTADSLATLVEHDLG